MLFHLLMSASTSLDLKCTVMLHRGKSTMWLSKYFWGLLYFHSLWHWSIHTAVPVVVTSILAWASFKQFCVRICRKNKNHVCPDCIPFLSPFCLWVKTEISAGISWDQFPPSSFPPLFHRLGVKTDGSNATTLLREVYCVTSSVFGLHLSDSMCCKSCFSSIVSTNSPPHQTF